MTEANKCGGVEWVAVCDAWDVRRDEARQLAGSGAEKLAETTARCSTGRTSTA